MSWFRSSKADSRSRLPRQLKTTREGKLLIGMTIGVGFAAINTGNNLLYLVLGMLLSMIVVSGILSELALRGVVVKRRYAQSVHAGSHSFMALEITNTKKRLRSYSVEVEELFESEAWGSQRPAHVLVLQPGQSRTIAIRATFKKRGVQYSRGLKIATSYPFNFFRKWREVALPYQVVVFPELKPVTAMRLQPEMADGPIEVQRKIGHGGEYHGLHEHHYGDDPRDIHWKTSARLGRLMIREYEAPGERRMWLIVPNIATDATAQGQDAAEATISEAASLAVHYTSSGWAVGVATLDGHVAPSTGAGHMNAIMSHLAVVPVHDPEEVRHRGGVLDRAHGGLRVLVRHPEQQQLPSGMVCNQVHQVPHVV